MKKTMKVGETTLNILWEFTSRNGITYRITALDNGGATFLFDNNNSKGEWYLMDIGSFEIMKDKVTRNCCR